MFKLKILSSGIGGAETVLVFVGGGKDRSQLLD